jgi:hypothetical protein
MRRRRLANRHGVADADGSGRLPAVSLLTDLDAFFTEHRGCGDLDAGVDGPVVWMSCDDGASIARRVDEDRDHATA